MASYERINWENYPSLETPLDADNLNRMDEAIDTIVRELVYVRSLITKNKTSADTAFDILAARISAIASLDEGSTSGDAELVDIRVGADGTTYESAGDAVRTQITNLKSALSNSMTPLTMTFQRTGHIEKNGQISSNTTFYNTDYTECAGPGLISFNPGFQIGNNAGLAVYDSNRTLLAFYPYNKSSGFWYNAILPPEAMYIRATSNNPDNFVIYRYSHQQYASGIRKFEYEDLAYSINILDFIDMFAGYVNGDGVIVEAADWRTTDYIECDPTFEDICVRFEGTTTGHEAGDESGFFLAIYDANKEKIYTRAFLKKNDGYAIGQVFHISNYIDSGTYKTMVETQHACYVRFSFNVTHNISVFMPAKNIYFQQEMVNKDRNIAIDYADSTKIVPGYYLFDLNGTTLYNRIKSGDYSYLTDDEKILACGVPSSSSLWCTQIKPIDLYKGDQLYIKAAQPLYFGVIIGEWYGVPVASLIQEGGGTAVGMYAVRPNDQGWIIINNPCENGPLRVYISTNIHFDRFQKHIDWEAYINDPSGKPIAYADQGIKTHESIYNCLNNALERDRDAFDADMFISPKITHQFTKKLTKLYFTSGSDRNITIAVGLHDQRDWFVASDTFSFAVKAGKNIIDVTANNIVIPAGYQVAVNALEGETYYKPQNSAGYSWKYEHFTSLSNIALTELPLTVIPLFEYDYEILTAIGGGSGSSSTSEKPYNYQIFSTPNGTLYRLQLSEALDIIKTKVIPRKYLAIGNSVTQHGISQAVNWQVDDRGMAATRAEKDYVHRLATYFDNADSTFSLFRQANCAFWETETEDRSGTFNRIDAIIDEQSDWDLITIQLGENASDTTTLQADYINLIKHIKTKCPDAFVVMIGDCFRSTSRDLMKKNACKVTFTPFVDLSGYTSASNFYSSMGTIIYKSDGTTFEVTNSGVAGHPGDNGFRIIAQEILKILLNDSTISLSDN